jgi:hypothetical protein
MDGGGRGSLQRGNVQESSQLGEGQVEVLHDPQHRIRLDVGPAQQERTRDPWLIYVDDDLKRKFNFSYLSFSTRTTLEMSSGDLPDLRSSFLPDSLCRGMYLMLLPGSCSRTNRTPPLQRLQTPAKYRYCRGHGVLTICDGKGEMKELDAHRRKA